MSSTNCVQSVSIVPVSEQPAVIGIDLATPQINLNRNTSKNDFCDTIITAFTLFKTDKSKNNLKALYTKYVLNRKEDADEPIQPSTD